jgi:hypothetical protein
MATSTELKDSLQRISALMGLLRSDFLELSEAKGSLQRGPVVEHIQWIADQLDELRHELATDKPRRSHASHAHATDAEGSPKHTVRHDSKHHAEIVETPPLPDDPKQPDDGSDDAGLPQGEPVLAPEKDKHAAPHDEAAAVPPPPDVPKPREDDKPH